MKQFLVVVSFLMASIVCAQEFSQELDDNGSHVFETTISFLASNKIKEEICVQNNSACNLQGLTLQVRINEKSHDFKKMPKLPVGMENNFEGYEDDEMKDELKFYFGGEGKLSKSNKNKIVFIFDFGADNDHVVLGKVYKSGNDIYFEIIDNPTATVKQGKSAGGETVTINGESYLLIDGTAYKIVP